MGVSVPGVLGLDWEAGWMAIEWIEGRTVRQVLDARIHDAVSTEAVEGDLELRALMGKVGGAIGKMHEVSVVHGDLTTSNLMVKGDGTTGNVVIIDFGLGVQSGQDEDRAVDLYVLERAFVSTHPLAEGLFQEVLRAYTEAFRGGKVVLKKLEDVRQRGRKKSMLG
jgi:TP53 regulating kinase-like protein